MISKNFIAILVINCFHSTDHSMNRKVRIVLFLFQQYFNEEHTCWVNDGGWTHSCVHASFQGPPDFGGTRYRRKFAICTKLLNLNSSHSLCRVVQKVPMYHSHIDADCRGVVWLQAQGCAPQLKTNCFLYRLWRENGSPKHSSEKASGAAEQVIVASPTARNHGVPCTAGHRYVLIYITKKLPQFNYHRGNSCLSSHCRLSDILGHRQGKTQAV